MNDDVASQDLFFLDMRGILTGAYLCKDSDINVRTPYELGRCCPECDSAISRLDLLPPYRLQFHGRTSKLRDAIDIIGGSMTAENFLNLPSLGVMALGLVAMVFATAGGILIAKVMNLFLKHKINPMIGAAGISAFPMAGRVVAKMALAEDKQNYLLMQAMAVNISGQLCSIVAGVVVIAIIKVVLGS